jgi:hypothetical protein
MTTRQNQTTKLGDTQLVLLSAASQRQDRRVTPSDTITERAFTRALNGLVKQGLVSAVEPDPEQRARGDGDAQPPAFVVTPAGLTAIGLPDVEQNPVGEQDARETDQPGRTASAAEAAVAQRAPTKKSLIIAMLSREEGAALDDLISATGWLPHTTRAALTGLRQKGYLIERTPRENRTSVYRMTAAAHQG